MAKLKIFRLDEYSWYVAHDLMEFLNWYHKNVNSIETPEELSELEIIELDKGCMWSNENIAPEDIEKMEIYDEDCNGGIGDLMRRGCDGEIFKMQTFADVLGDEDIKEPYEIASTEW